MGKIFMKMLKIPLENKFWGPSDSERVESSLEKNRNKRTNYFFYNSYSEQVYIFLKLLVVHAKFPREDSNMSVWTS